MRGAQYLRAIKERHLFMGSDSVRSTKRFSRWLRQKMLHSVTPIGYTPINEYARDDIFIVGYPKSGNTWFQTLISGAVHGVLPELVPMSVVQSLVPDVHAVRWYQRHAPVTFFKSHHLPQRHYRRVIYLLRDGRDAMVSYHHYQQAIEGRSLDFLQFIRAMKFSPANGTSTWRLGWKIHLRPS